MRELLVRFLGKDLTKWDRLRAATGVVSDEDLLNKLIDFYAEAKGISLTEPQMPPQQPPAPLFSTSSSSRTVTVSVRPMKGSTTPSSVIVIHQNDPVPGGDSFLSTGSDEAAVPQPVDQNGFPMLMLREDQDEAEEGVGEERQDPGEDDFEEEFRDIPLGKAKGVYYRERVRSTVSYRCTFYQDEHSRALDGMLWREAVMKRRQMPLEDVKLVRSSDSSYPISPTVLPWVEPPPVQEYPSEGVLLQEFGCGLCDKLGFNSRVEMITHFWLQHPETRERSPTQYLATKRDPDFAHCSLCMLTGSVAPAAKHNKLAPHMENAHAAVQRASELAPYVCDVCHEELKSEEERDSHLAAAHPEHEVRRIVCLVCGQEERGTQAYIRHLRIHYTEFVYSCNICPNFRSRRPQTMTAHTESHERRTFRCGRCQFQTRTFRTLVDHIRIHLQLPRHVCPVCGYRAYTSSRYFNHMDSHGGRKHRCETCSEEFTSVLKKSHHKILVHRKPAKFTCDRCDITFQTSFRLRRHQASHTGLKPFSCELCGKGLSSRQSLKNHSRICPENDEMYRHGTIVEMVAT